MSEATWKRMQMMYQNETKRKCEQVRAGEHDKKGASCREGNERYTIKKNTKHQTNSKIIIIKLYVYMNVCKHIRGGCFILAIKTSKLVSGWFPR